MLGHAKDTQLCCGVEDRTFHMHVITLHELGVPRWGKRRGAGLAASVNTPRPLLSDCEGHIHCDASAAGQLLCSARFLSNFY